MTTFFDFFYSALPWVSIGIIVAILVANSVVKPSDTSDKSSTHPPVSLLVCI